MNLSKYYYETVLMPIGKGCMAGGYTKLKEMYPNRMREIDNAINSNFCIETIDAYANSIRMGLKKINHWRES